MEYVLNLNTKNLSPMPTGPGDVSSFIPPNAIVIGRELAAKIAKADAVGRERIVTAILGKRLIDNVGMTPEARKILEAGMGALKADMASVSEEPEVKDDSEEEASIHLELESNGGTPLLTKRQVSKLNHPNLLKYAREALGLECADNEPYEVLKAKVYAKQFGEE